MIATDPLDESVRLHKIVEEGIKVIIDRVIDADLNPTGLASLFLGEAMGLLDRNIQYCLSNEDPKGALNYLNIFLMDITEKTEKIKANTVRLQESLDGTEKDGIEVQAIKFRPDDHR